MGLNMKTITFYSFKGGVGRSLAVAQLAVLLAKKKKSVVALDFDLEAPGLKEKFNLADNFGIIKPGLVEYIQNYIYSGKKKKGVLKNSSKKNITLWPAGDALKEDLKYWKMFVDPELQSFLSDFDENKNFFEELKNKIETDLDPTPEYLLIDSRSGINEYSGICTRLFPDIALFFLNNNREGILGTKLILSRFEKARKNNERVPEKIYVVLSRIPMLYVNKGRVCGVTEEKLEKIKSDIKDEINKTLSKEIDEIHVLRTDPLIEIKEDLPLTFTGSRQSILLNDYIDLFSRFIPEIDSKEKKSITDIQTLRPFMLIEKRGKMINPHDDDKNPNVALRVDTVDNSFETFYDGFYDKERIRIYNEEKARGVTDKQAEDNAKSQAKAVADEIAFKSGNNASQSFINYLSKSWKKRSISYKAKLDEWCEFDSEVGLGKFENIWDEENKTGEIRLINSFLTHKRAPGSHKLCEWMRGYILQVLNAIFAPHSVNVKHDIETRFKSRTLKTEEKVCFFPFEVFKKE